MFDMTFLPVGNILSRVVDDVLMFLFFNKELILLFYMFFSLAQRKEPKETLPCSAAFGFPRVKPARIAGTRRARG